MYHPCCMLPCHDFVDMCIALAFGFSAYMPCSILSCYHFVQEQLFLSQDHVQPKCKCRKRMAGLRQRYSGTASSAEGIGVHAVVDAAQLLGGGAAVPAHPDGHMYHCSRYGGKAEAGPGEAVPVTWQAMAFARLKCGPAMPRLWHPRRPLRGAASPVACRLPQLASRRPLVRLGTELTCSTWPRRPGRSAGPARSTA